jgi:23S rRNA-/tRNA-specific pseudouridylate synthase
VKEVSHLKGGVHKYLEEFGNDTAALFVGKNFVFDTRLAATADTVGRCISCKDAFDAFDPRFVCTVCREPVLVCLTCREATSEFHCKNHSYLKSCYFSCLEKFNAEELIRQRTELLGHLGQIAVGRRFKQKRKTLVKQVSRLTILIDSSTTELPSAGMSNGTKCRSCNRFECDGKCWGFHGLARKRKVDDDRTLSDGLSDPPVDMLRRIAHHQESLLHSRGADHSRLENGMHEFACRPPSMFRDEVTGIRVPEAIIRTLQCQTKAKWCGHTLVDVVTGQFSELRRPDILRKTIDHGLLFLNGRVVSSMAEASEYRLRHSDCISRVVHWHEAPVKVPARICVQMVEIPSEWVNGGSPNEKFVVFVCDKPSTVPVHPAGPYFANSLTCMLEGQESLSPGSCKPIHRTDRATSGLTLCCTNAVAANAFHRALAEGNAEKMYLARVGGKFPSDKSEWSGSSSETIGKCKWRDELVLVDAPVGAVEAATGMGSICANGGKAASTLFRMIGYDAKLDASLVACRPITGRNHQIRLHLKWLGFPIIGDTLYGGRSLSSEMDSNKSTKEEITNNVIEVMLRRCMEQEARPCDEQNVAVVEQRARQACTFCSRQSKEEIIDSYSTAQLLQDGHEIHLHALRYKFILTNSKSAAKEEVSFEVGLPSWAPINQCNQQLCMPWGDFNEANALL